MAKAKLLNDGYFEFMSKVETPVIVRCEVPNEYFGGLISVHRDELVRIGADSSYLMSSGHDYWHFEVGAEAEIIEE